MMTTCGDALVILMTSLVIVDTVERGFVYCPAYPCTCESKGGALIINCGNLYLSALPKFLSFDGRIKELSLRHNSIQHLPAKGFEGLHVEKLDLLDNAVTSVHEDAFRGLENSLKALSIQLYALNGLPTPPLSKLSRLTSLVIVGCRQQELRAELFVNLTALQELHLVGCRISHIQPGAFAPLVLLQTLVLKQNSIRYQHLKEFNALDDLAYLDLSSNDIQRLDDLSFSQLSNLRTLNLAFNKLVSISRKAFHNLDFCLEELDLHQNEIRESALESLRHLKVVRRLDLSSNDIASLSGGYFAGMRFLAQLLLAWNDITKVSRKCFVGLGSTLRELDLHGNPLQQIEPGTFIDLGGLEQLNVNTTHIGGSFQKDTFKGLAISLQSLDVSRSAVVSDDLKAFTCLSNLTWVDLSHNLLTSLEFKVMESWRKLKAANFSHNNISSVFKGDIIFMDSPLSFLDLSWNKVQSIQECAFFVFKELRDVRLSGNPLVCKCSLAWLYRWLQITQYSLNDGHKWVCKFPAALENVLFTDLDYTDFSCPNSSLSYEERCLALHDDTGKSEATTRMEHVQMDTVSSCDPLCLNISRPNSYSLFVQWLAQDYRQVVAYDVLLKRRNDSTELQSTTVSANASNITFPVNTLQDHEVCIVALAKDLVPLATKCKGVTFPVTTSDSKSRKTDLNNLIQNSFLPLMFIYISGSLALAFIVACIIICIRRRQKKPRRVKPFYLAYPAWLDNSSSVSSAPLTHDPHFLNSLFTENSQGRDFFSHSAMFADGSDPHGSYPDSPLPLDIPTTLPTRRDSRPTPGGRVCGYACSTLNSQPHHFGTEILPGRSEVDDEFFFHF